MASVLIVEDEEKLARMLELELNYEGYKTEKAFDGRTGLELALSGKYDLILLDIMLPQLSGILRTGRRGGGLYHKALCHRGAAGPHPGDAAQGQGSGGGAAGPARRSRHRSGPGEPDGDEKRGAGLPHPAGV